MQSWGLWKPTSQYVASCHPFVSLEIVGCSSIESLQRVLVGPGKWGMASQIKTVSAIPTCDRPGISYWEFWFPLEITAKLSNGWFCTENPSQNLGGTPIYWSYASWSSILQPWAMQTLLMFWLYLTICSSPDCLPYVGCFGGRRTIRMWTYMLRMCIFLHWYYFAFEGFTNRKRNFLSKDQHLELNSSTLNSLLYAKSGKFDPLF